MNKQLFLLDTNSKLSLQDMIDKVEKVDNKVIYYYNKNYIIGKTVQYEIFKGIWIIYHDLVLKNTEIYPLESDGLIQMNYCVSGRCELNYKNNKVFYVGPGDFSMGILRNKQYKHTYPLEKYKGISIITTEEKMDNFLQTLFNGTKLNCKKLIMKMKKNSDYIILLNNSEVKSIIGEMLLSNCNFFKEKVIVKFAELLLLLFSNDVELQSSSQYYDRQIVNLVKRIERDVTSNIEVYVKIADIARKYSISSKMFSKCFKDIYGKTYYSFIKEFRIKKSAELLLSKNFSVGDIALMVGYQNASKFSKAFSDIMGVTPIFYRRNNSVTFLE